MYKKAAGWLRWCFALLKHLSKMFTVLVICMWRRLCVCFLNGRTQLYYCARLVCVYGCNKAPNLQLCSAVGGLQRDQDQQGEEETGRLHSGCGTAQGSALLSRGLSTPLINLSEDVASGEKSFILAFLENVQKKKNKKLHPFPPGWDVRMNADVLPTTGSRHNYIPKTLTIPIVVCTQLSVR